MDLNNTVLKFAPLIRVSTESQAKKGESLHTQRKQAESAIKNLGGTISKWYSGQEHATPDQERKILKDLIDDAKLGKFNAIWITDTSRWSRDNKTSKKYLEILQENKIRFFVGSKEFDLSNYTDCFFLGMSAEIAEYFANEQNYKSLINRIERAKKGCPSCGKLPYGRKYDEKSGWSIDPEKQKIVFKMAQLYLNGTGFPELSKIFKMNASNIHKILTKRSGSTWYQKFRSKRLGINETVPTQIPELLPDGMIAEIIKKCKERKTWNSKSKKNEYLFSRIIFDFDSGRALTGTANCRGQRYYKPYGINGHRYQINADVLESAILNELFEIISCKHSFIESVFIHNPTNRIREELSQKKQNKHKQLTSIEKKIANIMKFIEEADGCLTNSKTIANQLDTLEREMQTLREEIISIKSLLENLPSEDDLEKKRLEINDGLKKAHLNSYLSSGVPLMKLSFEKKRELIKMFFLGKDYQGKKFGIYIRHIPGLPRKYRFEAYGAFGNINGFIKPRIRESFAFSDLNMWTKEQKQISAVAAKFVLESDTDLIHSNVKEHLLSECHAYNSFCIHQ